MGNDLVESVIEGLARAENVPVDELDYALYDYIDPDVFVTLAAQEDATWEFTVEVADHEVLVTSEGSVFVDGVRADVPSSVDHR